MITFIHGDITSVPAEIIVNAANRSLLGGGGVDGVIHRKAGPQLMADCRTLHGCETGQAKVTKAYDLSCRWIIHTVGPVWSGGRHQEVDLLASCYRQSLRLARQLQKEYRLSSLTIVFPCISTGVYHFHKALACSIAVDTVRDTLSELKAEKEIDVIFCCYESEDAQLYKRQLDNKGD